MVGIRTTVRPSCQHQTGWVSSTKRSTLDQPSVHVHAATVRLSERDRQACGPPGEARQSARASRRFGSNCRHQGRTREVPFLEATLRCRRSAAATTFASCLCLVRYHLPMRRLIRTRNSPTIPRGTRPPVAPVRFGGSRAPASEGLLRNPRPRRTIALPADNGQIDAPPPRRDLLQRPIAYGCHRSRRIRESEVALVGEPGIALDGQ
jgi:hypothetical protein